MNNPAPSLLIRSPLRQNESLPSLLIRLTRENFYPSPHMVVGLCQERLPQRDMVTRPTKTETFRVLADLVKLKAEELYTACVHRFAPMLTPPAYAQRSIRLPAGDIVLVLKVYFLREQTWPESDVQFCPLCLKETAHHRVNWMPLAVAVCLRHQCLLVRGCPQCQARMRVRDVLATQCPECGFNLSQAPTASVAADRFGLFSQAAIQFWLGIFPPAEVHNLDGIPNEPPAILYHFVDGLRRTVMDVQQYWGYLYAAPSGVGSPLYPCVSKRDMTPAKSYILYATAFKAIVNWPQGFFDFLDAYKLRDGQQASGYIHRDFGRIYVACLEKHWRHPAFQFVQDAFNRYLLDNYTATPALARLRRLQDNPASWSASFLAAS